jgi:uncharacterized protein (DUF1697 family)
VPRYAAFLRGMNVGGHRITNDELGVHIAELGFADVRTFRASGNVILDAPGRDAPDVVARKLEAGLATALGYAVPVFVRDAAAVRAIASHEPFPESVVSASTGKLQVAFLHDPPGAAARKRALTIATADDRLAIAGAELYWLPARGVGRSELDFKALDGALGAMTVRTMGTIRELAAKHLEEPAG